MANLGDPVITTTQAVVACLGLDDADVPDAMIIDSGWYDELVYRLAKGMPNWQTTFQNGASATPTDNELAFATILRIYGKYFIADKLVNAPMAVPWLVSDGKDQMRRNDKIDLAALQAKTHETAEQYWQDLLAAYAVLFPVAVTEKRPPKIFGSSRPSRDPVTGGTYEAG